MQVKVDKHSLTGFSGCYTSPWLKTMSSGQASALNRLLPCNLSLQLNWKSKGHEGRKRRGVSLEPDVVELISYQKVMTRRSKKYRYLDNPSQTSKVNDASVSKDGLSYSYNDVLEQRKDVLEQRRDVLEQRKNVSVKRLGSLKKINVGIEVCYKSAEEESEAAILVNGVKTKMTKLTRKEYTSGLIPLVVEDKVKLDRTATTIKLNYGKVTKRKVNEPKMAEAKTSQEKLTQAYVTDKEVPLLKMTNSTVENPLVEPTATKQPVPISTISTNSTLRKKLPSKFSAKYLQKLTDYIKAMPIIHQIHIFSSLNMSDKPILDVNYLPEDKLIQLDKYVTLILARSDRVIPYPHSDSSIKYYTYSMPYIDFDDVSQDDVN